MNYDLYFTLVSICTGTLVAVFLRYYLALVSWVIGVGANACRRRITAARIASQGTQRMVALGDAVAALALCTSAAAAFIPVLLFFVPLAFTAYAFTLAAQAISIG